MGLPADPFSTYRSTFELRTYRLCRRALMFHHFAEEPGVGLNCLVRSTHLLHASAPPADSSVPSYAYLLSITQTGHVRLATGYLPRSLPPLEKAGVVRYTASGIGLGAAVATGAALGSFIPRVGTVAGVVIGGVVAGLFFLFSL
jgi:hypothetical protein